MQSGEITSRSEQKKKLLACLTNCSPRIQEQIVARLEAEKQKRGAQSNRSAAEHELNGNYPPWRAWLLHHFPDVCTAPFAPRHIDLWEWEEKITPEVRPNAFVAIWPRSGGKSTTVELVCARLCDRKARHFALIVSSTQDQANQRVSAISDHLQTLGIGRAVNQFGHSKGWRLEMLRTDRDFNVLAYGLDAASRGVKLGKYRPDFICLDDIDALGDTPETTAKKIQTITKTVLYTRAPNCAVLFVQNRILEFGVMSQLADGIVEFLLNRETISEEPAVIGLKTEAYEREDGRRLYRIVAGTPTWEGQNIPTCEADINESGLSAFLQECQHEVKGAQGIFFRADELRTIKPEEVPALEIGCMAGDFAATEGGGNYTALVVLGRDAVRRYYVFAVIRGQWSSERVNEVIEKACAHYLPHLPNAVLRLPQDPAAAGKRAATEDRNRFGRWNLRILPVTGKKADRAKDASEQVNVGNVYLVEQSLPNWLADGPMPYMDSMFLGWKYWHAMFREELRQFREDEKHDKDDQVDAFSDGFNEIMPRPEQPAVVSVSYLNRGRGRYGEGY